MANNLRDRNDADEQSWHELITNKTEPSQSEIDQGINEAENYANQSPSNRQGFDTQEKPSNYSPPSSLDQQEKDPGIYTPSSAKKASKGRGLLRGRKKRSAVAISLTTATLLMFISTTFLAPFRLVGLAIDLDRFYLKPIEQSNESMATNLFRNMRWSSGSQVQNRRLSLLQNYVADRLEADILDRTGLKISYENGVISGHEVVDVEKATTTLNKLNSEFVINTNITDDLGPSFIPTEGDLITPPGGTGASNRVWSAFNDDVINAANMNSISTQVAGRVSAKRGKFFRTFLQPQDGSFNRQLTAKYFENRKSFLDGVSEKVSNTKQKLTIGSTTKNTTNPDGGAIEVPADLGGLDELAKAGDVSGLTSGLTKVAKGIGGLGLVAGTVDSLCYVGGINDEIAFLRFTNTTQPMQGLFWMVQAVGGQIQSGNVGNRDEIGFLDSYLSNANGGAAEAAVYGSSLVAQETIEELDALRTGGPLNSVLKDLELGGKSVEDLCNFSESKKGIVAFAITDIAGVVLSGGATLLPSAAKSASLQVAMQTAAPIIAAYAANDPLEIFDDKYAGEPAGIFLKIGGALAGLNHGLGFGGKPLSASESLGWQDHMIAVNRQEDKEKGWQERIFALSNPRSLFSNIFLGLPASLKIYTPGVSSFSGLVSGVVSAVIAGIVSPLSSTYADVVTDFPGSETIPTINFSLDELQDDRYSNPVENMLSLEALGYDLQELHDTVGVQCFNTKLTEDTANGIGSMAIIPVDRPRDQLISDCLNAAVDSKLVASLDDYGTGSLASNDEYFLAQALSSAEQENIVKLGQIMSTEAFTRYRFHLSYNHLTGSFACWYGVEEICGELGYGGGSTLPSSNSTAPGGGQLVDSVVSGETVDLAQKVLDLAAGNGSVKINSGPALQSVQDATNEGTGFRSVTGNNSDGRVAIDKNIFKLVLAINEANIPTSITSITTGTPNLRSNGSDHYTGTAIDFTPSNQLADFLYTNRDILEVHKLIYQDSSDGSTEYLLHSGTSAPGTSVYKQSTLDSHEDHIHISVFPSSEGL